MFSPRACYFFGAENQPHDHISHFPHPELVHCDFPSSCPNMIHCLCQVGPPVVVDRDCILSHRPEQIDVVGKRSHGGSSWSPVFKFRAQRSWKMPKLSLDWKIGDDVLDKIWQKKDRKQNKQSLWVFFSYAAAHWTISSSGLYQPLFSNIIPAPLLEKYIVQTRLTVYLTLCYPFLISFRGRPF